MTDRLEAQIKVATSSILRDPTVKRSLEDTAYMLVDSLNALENQYFPKNRGPPYIGLKTDCWKLSHNRLGNYHANQYKAQFILQLENTQEDLQYNIPYISQMYKKSSKGKINNLGKRAKSGMVRAGGSQVNVLTGYIGNLSKVRQDVSGGKVKPKKKGGKLVWWNKKGEIVFRKYRKKSWKGHEVYKNAVEDRIMRFFSRGELTFMGKKGKQ